MSNRLIEIVWYDGDLRDSEIHNSIWKNGSLINCNMNFGEFHNGIAKNSKLQNVTWVNGVFDGGEAISCNWEDGIFKDGEWVNGIWNRGTWLGGKWIRGHIYDPYKKGRIKDAKKIMYGYALTTLSPVEYFDVKSYSEKAQDIREREIRDNIAKSLKDYVVSKRG